MRKEKWEKKDLYRRKENIIIEIDGGLEAIEDLRNKEINIKGLRVRERYVQRQMEDSRIREARYNKKYKDIYIRK